MSYILDALRRAEAERERGHVPGLHSQPLPAALAGPAPRRAWLPWTIGASVLALGAAAAGWWLRPVPPTPAPQPPQPAAVPTAAPAPLPVAPTASAPTPPVAVVAASPPAPAPSPTSPPPAAAPATPPAPAVATAPPAAVTAPTPAPVASAPAAVIAFDQLPDDVRRQLPAVQIGGAIYSDNAASRMLIVGGQLLREGDPVAPGVTLDTIKPRSAVLRWKTLRYEVTF